LQAVGTGDILTFIFIAAQADMILFREVLPQTAWYQRYISWWSGESWKPVQKMPPANAAINCIDIFV